MKAANVPLQTKATKKPKKARVNTGSDRMSLDYLAKHGNIRTQAAQSQAARNKAAQQELGLMNLQVEARNALAAKKSVAPVADPKAVSEKYVPNLKFDMRTYIRNCKTVSLEEAISESQKRFSRVGSL